MKSVVALLPSLVSDVRNDAYLISDLRDGITHDVDTVEIADDHRSTDDVPDRLKPVAGGCPAVVWAGPANSYYPRRCADKTSGIKNPTVFLRPREFDQDGQGDRTMSPCRILHGGYAVDDR